MRQQVLCVSKTLPHWISLFFLWHVHVLVAVGIIGRIESCVAFSPKGRNPRRTTIFRTTILHGQPVVAVVGGDLAGIAAASTIAGEFPGGASQVWLLTGHSEILKGCSASSSGASSSVPILPDPTLENRELIERYGHGGRELAGLLARQCTPLRVKEWLETRGVILRDEATAMTTLLQEKPLFVSPKCDLRRVLQDVLERAQVKIRTNVQMDRIVHGKQGFTLDLQGGETLQVDVLILANDGREIPSIPILVAKEAAKKAATTTNHQDFDVDLEEPVSLKDQMKLEQKQQKDAKRKKLDQLTAAESVDVNELTKKELRTLVLMRKKEAKKNKQRKGAQAAPASIVDDNVGEEDDEARVEGEQREYSLSGSGLDTVGLAKMLGHTVTNESLGCFSFMVHDKGPLEGCSKSIIPKARLRCKVEKKPKGRTGRLPAVECPFFLSQGEVSGPGASRLSALIAHEMAHSGNRGTLHIHFAPDVGSVEDLEAMLMEAGDPAASVLNSPCPLVHRQVDYDDYDMETGDFRSVEFPLVPKQLWVNLCQQAGIMSGKLQWKDLPPNSLQSLARVLVDCSLSITGIRPQENVMAGGVSLKEVNMMDCQSNLVEGLFLCGSTIDVHGFDGGFNPLAALVTGYVAGANAIQVAKEEYVEVT